MIYVGCLFTLASKMSNKIIAFGKTDHGREFYSLVIRIIKEELNRFVRN